MHPDRQAWTRIADYLGCFGQFRISSPICRRRCAMNLRCAIVRDQSSRMELLEEMICMQNQPSRIQ
jgi:hypothetical protein